MAWITVLIRCECPNWPQPHLGSVRLGKLASLYANVEHLKDVLRDTRFVDMYFARNEMLVSPKSSFFRKLEWHLGTGKQLVQGCA
jgi:hypothetical protein